MFGVYNFCGTSEGFVRGITSRYWLQLCKLMLKFEGLRIRFNFFSKLIRTYLTGDRLPSRDFIIECLSSIIINTQNSQSSSQIGQ